MIGDRVAAVALEELEKWKGVTEDTPRGRELIAGYWQTIGQTPQDPGVVPWSGAFVNAVIQRAAPGAMIKTASHIEMLRAQRITDVKKYGSQYRSLPASVFYLTTGAVAVRPRIDGPQITWDDVMLTHAFYPMHSDIVTGFGPGVAHVVGGNIGNSVAMRSLPIDNLRRIAVPGYVGIIMPPSGSVQSTFTPKTLLTLGTILGALWWKSLRKS